MTYRCCLRTPWSFQRERLVRMESSGRLLDSHSVWFRLKKKPKRRVGGWEREGEGVKTLEKKNPPVRWKLENFLPWSLDPHVLQATPTHTHTHSKNVTCARELCVWSCYSLFFEAVNARHNRQNRFLNLVFSRWNGKWIRDRDGISLSESETVIKRPFSLLMDWISYIRTHKNIKLTFPENLASLLRVCK